MGSLSERGLERRDGRVLFLRVAAYRANHEGRLPPINSDLWRAYVRLEAAPRRWWQRRHNPDRERVRTKPLSAFQVDKPFLTDDFAPEKVEERLSRWPMVRAFGLVDRHPMGEWFIYCVDVLAEDLTQAMRIVDCIFAVPQGAGEA